MNTVLQSFAPNQTVLFEEELIRRRKDNLSYMSRLTNENLLQNFTHEAGLRMSFDGGPNDIHGGWESPLCQLRGHFLGHWLSAAAMHYAATGNMEIKAKADAIVAVLGQCQQANGGEWVGSIPEKYLNWIAAGRGIWAPQYTLHKTFMGLLDLYELAGNQQALNIAVNFAKWFSRWSSQFTREEFDNILDVETGGMLEVFAQLYGITGEEEHKELMNRYYRGRLFDPLLAGKDVLTNMHANTTIPEILGAAKAYEVTGEEKWLDIVKAYWHSAVTERGYYVTGSQTLGEIWTPKQDMNLRLGDKNQEHCVVYNMMRLAEFLLRHTGESCYADYWEQNLYNGIMAQGYWDGHNHFTHGQKSEDPLTGLLTYFLPLRGGSKKAWATETQDFFCCHGSLVQANAAHNNGIYYQGENSIAVCQYFVSDLSASMNGVPVEIKQRIDRLVGNDYTTSDSVGTQAITDITTLYPHDPNNVVGHLMISAQEATEFTLLIRIPGWIKGEPVLTVNGEAYPITENGKGFMAITKEWCQDEVHFVFQKAVTVCPLAGDDHMIAFMNGPVALAGLCAEERTLYCKQDAPYESLIQVDNEREWANWKQTFITKGQPANFRLWPLYQVGYERYTVYFPVEEK